MTESMSISVNGHSQVPPGFRFHPTEEELLNYYLKKKVLYGKIDLDVIRDVDLNKLEPWDIQEKCRIGSTPQNDWYFFSHKDKKYPTGTRTNRATAAGFWKATGRDKVIYSSFKRIGMRKTLVFYKGRAPHGQKSDWIMHEYRLDDNNNDAQVSNAIIGETTQEEGWVVCRIFKKKNYHKTLDSPSPISSSSIITAQTRTQLMNSGDDDGALEQIFQHMGRTCNEENRGNNTRKFLINQSGNILPDKFLQLPTLESPNSATTSQTCLQPILVGANDANVNNEAAISGKPCQLDAGFNEDWAAFDRLVASHLNGQTETSKPLVCFTDPSSIDNDNESQFLQLRAAAAAAANRSYHHPQDYNNSEIDLWSFTRSYFQTSDPLCHMSNTPV